MHHWNFAVVLDNPKLADRKLIVTAPKTNEIKEKPKKGKKRKPEVRSLEEEENYTKRELYISSGVLSAASPAMETQLVGHFAESKEKEVHIKLQNAAELKAYCDMIEILHRQTITDNMTNKDVFSMLLTAEKYQVASVTALAMTFIKSHLDLDLITVILQTTLPADMNLELIPACVRYLRENVINPSLNELWCKPTFTSLTFEAVVAVLDDPDMHTTHENIVYRAARCWCIENKATPTQRNKIFACIRWNELSSGFLHDVVLSSTKFPLDSLRSEMTTALQFHAFGGYRRAALGASTFAKTRNHPGFATAGKFELKPEILHANGSWTSQLLWVTGYAFTFTVTDEETKSFHLKINLVKEATDLHNTAYVRLFFTVLGKPRIAGEDDELALPITLYSNYTVELQSPDLVKRLDEPQSWSILTDDAVNQPPMLTVKMTLLDY